MHDLFPVQHMIEEAKKHGNVKEVSVEMGELCDLHDHDIKGRIEQLTDWKVNFSIKPAKVRCANCNYEGAPKILEKTHDQIIYTCPQCNSKPKVIEGKELILIEVKVE